jgi:hypothetical protein
VSLFLYQAKELGTCNANINPLVVDIFFHSVGYGKLIGVKSRGILSGG